MFGANLKATNSSFQKGMTFCRSIYKERVMKLLAFIFKQPLYARLGFDQRSKTAMVKHVSCLLTTEPCGWCLQWGFLKIELSKIT